MSGLNLYTKIEASLLNMYAKNEASTKFSLLNCMLVSPNFWRKDFVVTAGNSGDASFFVYIFSSDTSIFAYKFRHDATKLAY